MAYTIADEAPIINIEKAIRDLGDEDLFKKLINDFDATLIKTLEDLRIAMDGIDYKEIRMKSHSLKGPSSYIQAERVRRSAEILQQFMDKQDAHSAFKAYPQLIKECITLRRHIRKHLSKASSI